MSFFSISNQNLVFCSIELINKDVMIIQEIKEKLESSTNPIAKSLHKGSGFNVLAIGFKKDMILKEHKANLPSKLTVLEGYVVYQEDDRVVSLNQYDEVMIEVDVPHSVKAFEDSLCLLTQG